MSNINDLIYQCLKHLRELTSTVTELKDLIKDDPNYKAYTNTLKTFIKDDFLLNALINIDLINISNEEQKQIDKVLENTYCFDCNVHVIINYNGKCINCLGDNLGVKE